MAEPVRNVFCAWYPLCLSVHVRNNKQRFTCSGCARYRPLIVTPEEIADDALNCKEFLRELFFGVFPYERHEMKKAFSDDETIPVPARVLKGIIFSFTQGMHSFAATSNLIQKIDDILKQGKSDEQLINDSSGNANEGHSGTEDL